ncbi:hypothetical protein KI387_012609, partial [Taxus chinensis]
MLQAREPQTSTEEGGKKKPAGRSVRAVTLVQKGHHSWSIRKLFEDLLGGFRGTGVVWGLRCVGRRSRHLQARAGAGTNAIKGGDKGRRAVLLLRWRGRRVGWRGAGERASPREKWSRSRPTHVEGDASSQGPGGDILYEADTPAAGRGGGGRGSGLRTNLGPRQL